MIYRLFPLVFFVLLFESCTAQNETSSQNQIFLSDAYGVTSHITRKGERWNYATKRRELQMMSEIGVNCCRFNFDAYNITSSGKGGMSSPIFDEVCQELKKTGMEFLPILSDYSNGKYAWQGEWYEKYVTYLSSKYGKEATYWEVMNEIDHPNNIKHFINGCSDYVNVLKKTNDIIKKSNPTAKILCSSLCDLKYTFLDSLSRLGAYEYFDIGDKTVEIEVTSEVTDYKFNFYKKRKRPRETEFGRVLPSEQRSKPPELLQSSFH